MLLATIQSRTQRLNLYGIEENKMIEKLTEKRPAKVTAVLFDFDGTISLVREGWQQIMTPYFADELKEGTNYGENMVS